ncbi:MAG: glycoside hydrolase family 43 protein [Chitinispirillaceae bacterium]|nr:glycoside hydrolase family 43 protein [Chitinispirillaceae bacterium]
MAGGWIKDSNRQLMNKACRYIVPVLLAGILFERCLSPYQVPPEPPLPHVPDTTLHDTGIVDGESFRNPIIPGFHPDPSICRVGQDYYLVNSSFEYFPGIPIHHSRDLVHWRQIGNCLTRSSQLDLYRTNSNGGIGAPAIRYHNGLFYLIVTETSKKGNIFFTARDPAGPWSEPVSVPTEGFDPSLFFDEDGKVYYQSQEGSGSESHIIQYRIDPATGSFLSQKKTIWTGDGDVWLEGPHLYKINGVYYLTAASGGTGWNHHQLVAASNRVFGPYIDCPINPVLSHQGTSEPIQYTGHADLFQDHNGHWWAVFLAVRHLGFDYSPLCRETFLAPLRWEKGWPVIGDNGRVSLAMKGPLPGSVTWEPPPARDEFSSPNLPFHFLFLRNPKPGSYSLSERQGWLRLYGNPLTMSDQDAPAFVGRRQQHFDACVRVKMAFSPQNEGEEAGMTVRLNERAHYEIALVKRAGAVRIIVRSCTWGKICLVDSADCSASAVFLQVACRHEAYSFSWSPDSSSFDTVAELESKPLSMESIHAFTGVVIGMYATGNGKKCAVPADFDWIEYRGTE